MKLTRFEDLECWKNARILVDLVYKSITTGSPFQKDFRLVNQVTGAAVSIMGNIAEGFVRRSNKEFIQFLFIAVSSAAELQSHFYVAIDQNYITQEKFEEIYAQAEKTSKQISGLITYLRNNEKSFKQKKHDKLNKPE